MIYHQKCPHLLLRAPYLGEHYESVAWFSELSCNLHVRVLCPSRLLVMFAWCGHCNPTRTDEEMTSCIISSFLMKCRLPQPVLGWMATVLCIFEVDHYSDSFISPVFTDLDPLFQPYSQTIFRSGQVLLNLKQRLSTHSKDMNWRWVSVSRLNSTQNQRSKCWNKSVCYVKLESSKNQLSIL